MVKLNLKKHGVFISLFLAFLTFIQASEAVRQPDFQSQPTSEVGLPEKLHYENEMLRKENQALRKQLIELQAKIKSIESKSAARSKIELSDPLTEEYWLSTPSNVRHNPRCRYFKRTKGAPCDKKDGTPCKICGG